MGLCRHRRGSVLDHHDAGHRADRLVQAAIAAVHDEADRAEDTDWAQILGLYDPLHNIAPGPMVTLSVVAVAMAHGPRDELDQLAAAEADPALAEHHRVEAVLATVCVKKQPKLVVF